MISWFSTRFSYNLKLVIIWCSFSAMWFIISFFLISYLALLGVIIFFSLFRTKLLFVVFSSFCLVCSCSCAPPPPPHTHTHTLFSMPSCNADAETSGWLSCSQHISTSSLHPLCFVLFLVSFVLHLFSSRAVSIVKKKKKKSQYKVIRNHIVLFGLYR